MNKQTLKVKHRIRRHRRVRKHVKGTAERPRMTVFRSLKHMYVQLIDDLEQKTVLSASTLMHEVQEQVGQKTGDKTAAAIVGKVLAEKALQAGIKKVAFDRGGYKYHGRVKALAEAAREAGLEF